MYFIKLRLNILNSGVLSIGVFSILYNICEFNLELCFFEINKGLIYLFIYCINLVGYIKQIFV